MKKITIAMVCMLAIAGCKQKGQTDADASLADSLRADSLMANSVYAEAAKLTPEDIEVDWANKEITVQNGGKQPDIVTLLKAFHKAWPTDVLADLLDMASDPKFTRSTNGETGGAVTVDRKNGFVEFIHGDAPGDNVTAAMWNRKDGNRLLIINIVRPGREVGVNTVQALCAYDYEPNSQTLRPERNAVVRFRQSADMTTTYTLPRDGKDISIVERDNNFRGTFHIFTWDGQNFSKESTISEEHLTKALNGKWTTCEADKPQLTFTITNNDETYCAITDCNAEGTTDYEAAANVYDGFLHLYEASAPDETNFDPSINCKFRLLKDGRLRGTYFLRLDTGQEVQGEMTLQKESELSQYSE